MFIYFCCLRELVSLLESTYTRQKKDFLPSSESHLFGH